MTCDATHFRIEAEIVISENGREIHRRAWDEKVPRDHL